MLKSPDYIQFNGDISFISGFFGKNRIYRNLEGQDNSSVSKGVNPNAETNAKNSLTGSTYDENATYDLSANALFATNGFMPTTFLQWVFVFILILFIIALFRKLYVSDKYKATPLRHA
jgi:hypothetical protein